MYTHYICILQVDPCARTVVGEGRLPGRLPQMPNDGRDGRRRRHTLLSWILSALVRLATRMLHRLAPRLGLSLRSIPNT